MDDVKEILSQADVFQRVDQKAVQALLGGLEMVRFPRGIIILSEGKPGDRLYIIIDGKAKLARHSADGRENLLVTMGPSDMFGEFSVLDPGPCTSLAVCVTEVSTVPMSANRLQEWVGSHLDVPAQLLRMLARHLRCTNSLLTDLIFADVPDRVAKSLLQLVNRFGIQEGSALHANHGLTQEEIAQLVGASQETVNKALTEFTHRGWIRLEGKSVFISDTEHLARHVR